MISRRRLLMATGALMFAIKTDNLFARQDYFPLWPDKPPGGGGPDGGLRISANGSWSNIVSPGILRFVPEKPNGKAVLIAAGGGYRWIGMGREGWPVAHWLNSKGFTAYVLSYRLPGEKWHDGSRVSLQDAQRAMRLVRSMEQNVHLLGFSAGGHLLGMAAARPDFASYPPQDAIDQQVPQANSVGLIYPVITLEPPYTHTNTHLSLVGHHPTPAGETYWSVQNYITHAFPSLFLAQAEDDATSNPENSVIMHDACRRKGVPVQMIRISQGGHGFGLGKVGSPAAIWDEAYAVWLAARV